MHIFVRSRVVSVAIGATLFASLFSVAPIAQAATLSTTQIDAITNLLQAFGADPAVVANVQAVLEGTATSTFAVQSSAGSGSVSGGNGCDVVSGNLQLGTTGAEVSQLQSFLSKDKSIYPEGSITGYFGPMTEDAVQRWQSAHNIVATGTPSTTGFGVVGPQTLKEMDHEMEMECESGDSNTNGSDNTSASSTSSESHASVDNTAPSTSGEN
ncbi:MAG: peptidoglycan-binding domain-containing protein [Minisyncoccota bacterium]